ncbi:hypothetical protein ACWGS9_10665 [Bradyrhizobium sp. Arg314]
MHVVVPEPRTLLGDKHEFFVFCAIWTEGYGERAEPDRCALFSEIALVVVAAHP